MILNENYKDIKDYEDLYEVSDTGLVRNKATGRILKLTRDKDGYLQVSLYKDGIRKTYRVHRLVAQAFIPNPNNYSEVNHIDENKTNNNVENVEWCSRQYNNEYSLSKPVCKYALDGRLLNTYKSIKEASKQTGIAQGNICRCCRGKDGSMTAGGFIWKYRT